MSDLNQLVVFTLDEQRYALPLHDVERIVRAVEITRLPKAPETVLGVINVQGEIVPVVNIRSHIGLPGKEMSLNDQLIIAHTAKQSVVLLADAVDGVVEVLQSQKVLPCTECVKGIVKLDDRVLLILDLDSILEKVTWEA